jgi:hypothetical protein
MLNATDIVSGGDRAQVFIVELQQRLVALSAHQRRQCLSLPQVASISTGCLGAPKLMPCLDEAQTRVWRIKEHCQGLPTHLLVNLYECSL